MEWTIREGKRGETIATANNRPHVTVTVYGDEVGEKARLD